MTTRHKIQLVITDLDNTLYDWVAFFVPAFYRMVDCAVGILEVDREKLLDELKAVHQNYHNSEQPFAILETPSVAQRFPAKSPKELRRLLDEAFRAFNTVRNEKLRLYPGVASTIRKIRDAGTVVVGHTEAKTTNSVYRAQLLGLDQLLMKLYAPQAVGLERPDGPRADFQELLNRCVRILPPDHRKPDPKVLSDICSDHHVPLEHSLYVGDSLTRDVFMARKAGARSAWAHYGSVYDENLWHKLVRVTHWTEDDVEREVRLRTEAAGIQPDAELKGFSDLLQLFEFGETHDNSTRFNAFSA